MTTKNKRKPSIPKGFKYPPNYFKPSTQRLMLHQFAELAFGSWEAYQEYGKNLRSKQDAAKRKAKRQTSDGLNSTMAESMMHRQFVELFFGSWENWEKLLRKDRLERDKLRRKTDKEWHQRCLEKERKYRAENRDKINKSNKKYREKPSTKRAQRVKWCKKTYGEQWQLADAIIDLEKTIAKKKKK